VVYTKDQALAILNEPIEHNGLVWLAQKLIHAKLNLACNNSEPSCIQQTVNDSDAMIGSLVVPPIGNGFLSEQSVSNLVFILRAYDNGEMCAPSCVQPPCPRPTPTPTVTPTPTPTPTPCQLDTPSVACDTPASSNIGINVTSGDSGAPNGFVVQWITLEEFIANGNQWPDDPAEFCEASFSYNLAPNQSIEVVIGDDRLFDSFGVQSDCSGDPLLCDTAYVFRCRASETPLCDASRWSNTTACATRPCNPGQNCTFTQGYWKNHPNVWPSQNLTLGAVSYSQPQLLQILDNPAQGNGLVILAHQLIAGKLNIANGADPSVVEQTIIDADNMIGGLVIPPIGNGYLPPGQTSNLAEALTHYNEGTIGPGHCED
jgi:hypothetical protein